MPERPELAVLYCCYTLDASARANLQTLRWYNPDVPVHVVKNNRPVRKDGWRNADQVLCQWYLAHRPHAERFALIESDMLCTVPLREHFDDTWDADLSAANVLLPGRDDHWRWWSEVGRLPAGMRPHATGAVPLAGILFSRRALDAIAPVICRPEMNDIFSELRVGTVAAALGMNTVETGPHAKRTVGIHRFKPAERGQPGLYHKVKGRRPARILIGALSGGAPPLVRRRESCRRTWFTGVGGYEGSECLFLLGDPALKCPELRGDELWLPCPDDYRSLPQKTRGFCRWALDSADFDYLFKCDDDTYVCLDRLTQVPAGLDYCGWNVNGRGYASGGAGYLLSRRAAGVVAEKLIEPTGPEDMLVGRHLRQAGISLVHDTRFYPFSRLSRAPQPTNRQITGHHHGSRRILRVHRAMTRKTPAKPAVPGDSWYSQEGQDRWVWETLGRPAAGYFVEAGAGDGVRFTNTLALEERGWTGICVEPTSQIDELTARRNCKCVQAMLGRDGETLTLRTDADDPQLSGDPRYMLPDRRERPGAERTLPTVALHTLLRQHDAPPVIDYLSLDTEGTELLILQAFDWSYRFRCITVEHNGRERELSTLLTARGYRLAKSGELDLYFVHDQPGQT